MILLKSNHFLLQFIVAIALVLCTVIVSTKITYNFKQLYYYDVDKLNIVNSSGLDLASIKSNYNYIIDYLNKNNTDKFALPTLSYSSSGATHFTEVKRIFKEMDYILLLCILFICIFIIIFKKNKSFLYLKIAGIILILIPLILIPLSFLDFDKLFTIFHKILFRNDLWLFDPKTDPIILILPEQFFMHCMMLIVTFSTLLGGFYLVLYKKITRTL
ncbi:TIGR01906 family membrane protein [Clostridium acidisoli]|uniref:TIGR01906 family membrane protein n=1 Tax=Clostridium acidisoli TaxID=91624 RepID=UPI003BFA76E3